VLPVPRELSHGEGYGSSEGHVSEKIRDPPGVHEDTLGIKRVRAE